MIVQFHWQQIVQICIGYGNTWLTPGRRWTGKLGCILGQIQIRRCLFLSGFDWGQQREPLRHIVLSRSHPLSLEQSEGKRKIILRISLFKSTIEIFWSAITWIKALTGDAPRSRKLWIRLVNTTLFYDPGPLIISAVDISPNVILSAPVEPFPCRSPTRLFPL